VDAGEAGSETWALRVEGLRKVFEIVQRRGLWNYLSKLPHASRASASQQVSGGRGNPRPQASLRPGPGAGPGGRLHV